MRNVIGFRRAAALQRDRICDSISKVDAARIEREVVIDDVDGGHTEGGDHADQLDAAEPEALAEPLRSSQYGKYLM